MFFFTASKLFALLATPSHLLVFLTLLAALALILGQERAGRYLAVLSAALFAVVGVLPTYIWLARPLEDRFPRPAEWPSHVDGVLVLGGGLVTEILQSRGVSATETGESRLIAATELARRYPGARILFSGGSGELGGSDMSEAEAAQHVFAQMGLDPRRLILESRSRNTFENIVFSKAIAKPQADSVWLLATDALQMPRSMQVAQKQGWRMIAWPTDYATDRARWSGFLDVTGNLSGFDAATHEWIGLLVYRLTGRLAPLA
jgi:uncharacterized SAM-binding protein YcdF (DUF218 family)